MREIYRPLEIIDSTLREGAQAPELYDSKRYHFRTSDKVAIARALILVGVGNIEVFSPSVSPREAEDLQAIIAERNRLNQEGKPYAKILAHVRCDARDAEAALKAGVDGLHFYIGTSEESKKHKFRREKTIDQITKIALDVIRGVRRENPGILIRFSGEDAFRTPTKELLFPYDAVAPYVDRFGTPDTVGTATPDMVKVRIDNLRQRFPKHGLEVHFHDDELRAVENAETAFYAGAQFIDTTPNGLGERLGITDMGSLFFRLYKRNPSLVSGYDISQIYSLNQVVATAAGITVRGIVNSYGRTHSAGVHTAAVLNNGSTYEGNGELLRRFGVDQTALLLGPLSGWHQVDYVLRNHLGFSEATEEQTKDVASAYKEQVHNLLEANEQVKPMDILRTIAFTKGLPYSPQAERTQIELILK